jgi:hypothetical protein
MSFYNQQHKHYRGVDLHARKIYVCIIDQSRMCFLPRKKLGIFDWQWIADFCNAHKILFTLGHAL